jgi:hypothetical protein
VLKIGLKKKSEIQHPQMYHKFTIMGPAEKEKKKKNMLASLSCKKLENCGEQ